jgi:hypothetical protein
LFSSIDFIFQFLLYSSPARTIASSWAACWGSRDEWRWLGAIEIWLRKFDSVGTNQDMDGHSSLLRIKECSRRQHLNRDESFHPCRREMTLLTRLCLSTIATRPQSKSMNAEASGVDPRGTTVLEHRAAAPVRDLMAAESLPPWQNWSSLLCPYSAPEKIILG